MINITTQYKGQLLYISHIDMTKTYALASYNQTNKGKFKIYISELNLTKDQLKEIKKQSNNKFKL